MNSKTTLVALAFLMGGCARTSAVDLAVDNVLVVDGAGAPAREASSDTYSIFARGLDMLNVTYHYLDIVPRGRRLPELLPRAPLRSQLVRADIDEGWPAGWWRGIT